MTYKMRVCDICGKSFAPVSGRQKRCGQACSRNAESVRAAELERQKPAEYIEAKREYRRQWYQQNKERVINANKQYRHANKNKQRAYFAKYRKVNGKQLKVAHKQWRLSNRDALIASAREARKDPAYRARQREYISKREALDPVFKLYRRVRARIKMAFKSQSTARTAKTFTLLGMTGKQFMEYLLSHSNNWHQRFTSENYGTEWVVDHIRPLASFDLSDASQVAIAFHYTNCQPLTPEENACKASVYCGYVWQAGVAVRPA